MHPLYHRIKRDLDLSPNWAHMGTDVWCLPTTDDQATWGSIFLDPHIYIYICFANSIGMALAPATEKTDVFCKVFRSTQGSHPLSTCGDPKSTPSSQIISFVKDCTVGKFCICHCRQGVHCGSALSQRIALSPDSTVAMNTNTVSSTWITHRKAARILFKVCRRRWCPQVLGNVARDLLRVKFQRPSHQGT